MFESIRQNSAYRSVRYNTIRKNSHTADKSQRFTQFRSKPKNIEESTFYKTRTIQLKPNTADKSYFFNPERNSYMESFQSMFQSEKNVKRKDDDIFQACEIKIKFTNFDKKFLKDDGTEFTLLDPFNRPYTYITNECKKQEEQLKSQRDQIKLLRFQLNTLRKNVNANLKNCQQQGLKGIDRLRQIIKKSQVAQQERKMRVRRQITELYEKHDQNLKLNDQINDRSRNMQRDIFNCQPFELEVEVEAE